MELKCSELLTFLNKFFTVGLKVLRMQILRCLLVARLHAQNFNQMFTAQMFSQETFSQTCVLFTISFLYDYV